MYICIFLYDASIRDDALPIFKKVGPQLTACPMVTER